MEIIPPPETGGGGGEETLTEQEIKYELSQPGATDEYVFVANKTLNSVTRINVRTKIVDSIPVGIAPTVLRTTPDNKTAVVLNSGEYSVSIVDAISSQVTTIPAVKYANNIVLSPTGKHAVAFYDPALQVGQIGIDPTRSFNQITVIDIRSKTSKLITVDFLPKAIKFPSDGSFAAVVTDSYLDIIDLTSTDYSLTSYKLTSSPSQVIIPSELELTPDGGFAFVLLKDMDVLVAVDLVAKVKSEIPVGPNATDLEVYPDSSNAMIINKGNNSITIVELPTLVTSTLSTSGIEFGQAEISPDTSYAMLFTNSPSTPAGGEFIHLMKLSDNSITTYPVIKGVDAIIMSPVNEVSGHVTAFIVHKGPGGTSTDPVKQFFYNHYAITAFNLNTKLSNPVALESKPEGFAFSADGAFGFSILPGASALLGIDLATQVSEGINLPSKPLSIGVMPGSHTAYIGADHPLGRIILVDADRNYLIDTITGFELRTK